MGWLIAAALLIVRGAAGVERDRVRFRSSSVDLYAAGKWLRANGGAACADYLVADAETAYWLHLAVLGNPRASERMQRSRSLRPADGGRRRGSQPKAAATRSLICAYCRPKSRSRVELAAQFGSAAVITRAGCYNRRL